jgi:hypothetical protein
MVVDFFKNLVRYRVEGVRSKAQAKVYGAKARAKSKASSKFNSAIDKPMNKAKAKAKGMGKGEKADKKPDKKAEKKAAKEEKARQKEEKAAAKSGKPPAAKRPTATRPAAQGGGARATRQEAPEHIAPTDSTQVIDISGLTDDRALDVVGWVVALNGVLRGRDFRLVTGKNVLGTAADCEIVVTDPYLSSKHAVIRHEDGQFLLIDLDSTNGTFVNDRRVSKMELIDNDKIRFGRTEMKFKSLF